MKTLPKTEFTEIENRHPENVGGPWMVSDECIDCGICYDLAPEFFKLAEDGSQAVVYRQPREVFEAEKELAEEACEACPVEAISCGLRA